MTDQPLPGLVVSGPEIPLVAAAARHLDYLRKAGLLSAEHELTGQLVLDLARVVGISTHSGKAAGAAMAARQLLDAIATLPAHEPEITDPWAELQAVLANAGSDDGIG